VNLSAELAGKHAFCIRATTYNYVAPVFAKRTHFRERTR
jgi:hypothetical protein